MLNTTLCYIEKDGCYLMLHRVKKKNDINHDKWIGVGGKFEDKESPEDCLLREAWEETGLTLTHWRYCGLITFICDAYETEYMHLFTADEYTGDLKECNEGDLQWVPIEQVLALPTWEGDKIFLKLMQEKGPFFSLKLTYVKDKLTEAVLNGVILKDEVTSAN
jgi:8-oxo-dGTP diphosphatase